LVPTGTSPLASDPTAPTIAPNGGNRAPFISLDLGSGDASSIPTVLKIVLMFAALAFIPAILLAMTSFTRIIVVLSMVRQGIGVAQLPPNRVLMALALFLTAFTMAPVFSEVHEKAIVPFEAGTLGPSDALSAAAEPMKRFMLAQTREDDLMLFIGLAGETRPNTAADVSIVSLVPAFIMSELKTAFQMGALLFLPFLVIELVVGSILMSMGMMMLPPATVSLPLKVLVFVAVDGWGLVVGSLAKSFGVLG
jgi:flagellar biosynthetic protein FliP